MQKQQSLFALSLLIVLGCALPVHAEAEKDPSFQVLDGPRIVTVGDNLATIDLSKEYGFINKEGAQKFAKETGNQISGDELGLVLPVDRKQEWLIYMEYHPMGYIKDDDADKLDANAILSSIKEGNDEANQERKEAGAPEVKVLGWQVPPHYDKVTHNLEWEILGESENEKLVNANTRLLGRRGVVSITLAGTPEEVKKAQSHLDDIIHRFHYVKGNHYSDFVPGQDKVAEMGLTALVAGGLGAAAVKTGIFAKFILPILLLLKKFVVVIIAAIAGLFGKLKNMLTGKKKPDGE